MRVFPQPVQPAGFSASKTSNPQQPSTKASSRVKIVLWALALSAAWTAALIFTARTVGLHSTPGMWTGAIGLPGVVLANWMQSQLFHKFNHALGYTLMFLINWGFYCSVLQGIISVKRRVWNS